MHRTVLISEEVTHAVSHCLTSQMQGSSASESENRAVRNWADTGSKGLHAHL